ncbi:TSUP family transporter [Kitasatospora sp. NPDC051853]|uniref:TSUP family transporter n=1 Tax=Kitasatospora sp. NPDC051853 TaxID=3364058 RepID=UPI0037A582C2
MTSAWVAELALGGVVLLGSTVQRMAGMGLALVAVPVLALLIGPAEGVALANCASGVISLLGLAGNWREVRPRAMVPLVLAAGCTVPSGVWVADRLPGPALLVGIGLLVTLAVLVVLAGARAAALRGTGGAVAAGAASGFMNSAAGVGGPALSLYAVNAGWTAREFLPNALFYGFVVNVFSVTAKGLPHLSGDGWTLAAAGIAGGAVIGGTLAGRVPERWARRVVLGIALAGGLSTLVKGVVSL